MKHLTVILCMTFFIAAHGQQRQEAKASLSADLAALISSMSIRLVFSHSFAEHWSAHGIASVQIPRAGIDQTESEHNSLLSDNSTMENERPEASGPEFMAGIRYWPEGFANGVYLGISCSHGQEVGTDISIGYGYAIRIIDNAGFGLGYELKLLESIKSEKVAAEGISIKLIYWF